MVANVTNPSGDKKTKPYWVWKKITQKGKCQIIIIRRYIFNIEYIYII